LAARRATRPHSGSACGHGRYRETQPKRVRVGASRNRFQVDRCVQVQTVTSKLRSRLPHFSKPFLFLFQTNKSFFPLTARFSSSAPNCMANISELAKLNISVSSNPSPPRLRLSLGDGMAQLILFFGLKYVFTNIYFQIPFG